MLGAHIHATVHHSRDIESKRQASAVTAGILLAIVEFMGDVRRVIGVENRRPVRRVPNLGTEHPDNAVPGPVGRHRGGIRYGGEGVATSRLQRELSVLYFECTKPIVVAEHIEKIIALR